MTKPPDPRASSPPGPDRLLLALAILLAGAALAPAQSEPPPIVERFQQVLEGDRIIPQADRQLILDARKKVLEELSKELTSPRDLVRVLVLREWRFADADDPDADRKARSDIDKPIFDALQDRLYKEFQKRLGSNAPAQQAAAAELIGEMASLVPAPDKKDLQTRREGLALRQFLAKQLLPELEKQSKTRASVAGKGIAEALGRVHLATTDVRLKPDNERIASALKNLQSSGNADIQRGVSEAVALMVQAISPEDRPMRDDARQIQPSLAPGDVVVEDYLGWIAPLAFQGLKDAQSQATKGGPQSRRTFESVERLNLDSLRRIIRAINHEQRLLVDPSLRPLRSKLTADEVARIKEARTAFFRQMKALRPGTATFQQEAEAMVAGLRDPSPVVRTDSFHLLEEISQLRELIRERYQLVTNPNVPLTEAEKQEPPPGGNLDKLFQQTKADLLRGMEDPNEKVRLAGVLVVGSFGEEGREYSSELVKRLRDNSLFVRWASARALGRLSDGWFGRGQGSPALPGVVEALTVLLGDPDYSVRAAAITALDLYGSAAESAIPDLIRLVWAGDVELRVAALKALGSIGRRPEVVVPDMGKALAHPDPRVRRAAASAIGRFGPKAALAEEALKKAVSDEDLEVRRSAGEALLALPVKD